MTRFDGSIPLTDEDVRYIEANFITVAALCAGRRESPREVRALMHAGRLPHAPYLVAGVERVGHDHLRLMDEAGGVDRLPAEFARRFAVAAARHGVAAGAADIDAEWRAYLSGAYAVCLRAVTPENIVEKEMLMRRLEDDLRAPRPGDPVWRERLRARADRFDALVREFAPCDRIRFGGPCSRERLLVPARALLEAAA